MSGQASGAGQSSQAQSFQLQVPGPGNPVLQTVPVQVPALLSMAVAGIGPSNSRQLLNAGVDGARNAPP